MQLVESKADIVENIHRAETYLTRAGNGAEREQMVELIRRGNNFIGYLVADENGESLHFVPSKYIGYKGNTVFGHLDNRRKRRITGSRTDVEIDKILGAKAEHPELREKYRAYCLKLGIPENKLTKRRHKFWLLEEPFAPSAEDGPDTSAEAFEGSVKEVLHRIHERDRAIIRKKKECARGALRCEVCGFVFSEKYGDIGTDFIEVHHTKPVAEMKPNETTKPEDLVLVCSNCHSMIHSRRPCFPIAVLKSLLK